MKSINYYLIKEASISISDASNLLLGLFLPDHFTLHVGINGNNLKGEYADFCVQRCVGQIIEALIFTQFEYYYNNLKQNGYEFKAIRNAKEEEATGINKSCDFYLKNRETGEYVNIEIKSYKKESNPVLTSTQNKADYILGIKYDIDGNNVTIKDIVLFSMNGKEKKRFSKEDTKDGFRLAI